MTDKEAMAMALEALENSVDLVSNEAREAEKMYANVPTRLARIQGLVALEVAHEKAITALKERLAQPEQEPTAKYSDIVSDGGFDPRNKFDVQPQRTWVGLKDGDISEIVRGTHNTGSFVRAIEAKLKDKNTPQRTEQNFCSRCGKRTKDIHTCTPPKENT